MKAERRHELQTNSLARFLENLPLYFRFHLTKIIVAALVVVLAVVLIRHRMTSGLLARQQTASALGDVRQLLGELQVVDLTRTTEPERAEARKRYSSQIDGTIDEILAQTDGPEDAPLRAEALVARGDLNWILANLPAMPGAATQPALQMPRSSEQYLAEAEAAYQQVLRQHPDRKISALTAKFGLASIAENRGRWDEARAQYDAILKQSDAPQALQDWAATRLQLLPVLQEPLFTGTLEPRTPLPTADPSPATAPGADPATQPATTAPAPQ